MVYLCYRPTRLPWTPKISWNGSFATIKDLLLFFTTDLYETLPDHEPASRRIVCDGYHDKATQMQRAKMIFNYLVLLAVYSRDRRHVTRLLKTVLIQVRAECRIG